MTTVMKPAEDAATEHASAPRRGWLIQAVTAVISIVIIAVPKLLGTVFYLDPILKRFRPAGLETASGTASAKKDANGFIRLDVTRSAVPADGTPVSVAVRDDITDAWNFFRDVPVGSIWLRRLGDQVIAFSSVCPHLGCAVSYRRAEGDFYCPCHTSVFTLDGKKNNVIPPRDLDTLELVTRTEGQDDPAGEELWVKYQNFRRATSEKIPI
jgi:menaquinol-cytochrome c reductase iron-sulfur subunit